MDVDTLVRHNLPVVMVVGNNGCWGLEKYPMQAIYGYDVACDLQAGVPLRRGRDGARGAGEIVRRPDEVGPALDRAFAAGVPVPRQRDDRPDGRLPAVVEPRLGAAQREVVAGLAHLGRDDADAHEQREDLASDAIGEHRLERRCDAMAATSTRATVVLPNTAHEMRAETDSAAPMAWAKRFGGPGTSLAATVQPRRDHLGDEQAERAEARTRRDAGREPVGQRHEHPVLAGEDRGDHQHDSRSDEARRHLVHRIRER